MNSAFRTLTACQFKCNDRSHLSLISIDMTKIVLLLFSIISVNVLGFESSREVDITDFPYHVSIRLSGKHICSGAFVQESWVITVASCVYDSSASDLKVRVRTSSLISNGDDISVSSIVIHHKFDEYMYFNDIALIKLRSPADFGAKLLPIALPQSKDVIEEGTISYVTGWKRNLDGSSEEKLSVTAVPVINQDTCRETMPSYRPVSDEMVCAGNLTKGVETCQGDPGAPLTVDQKLIGILSYGLGCETTEHPGVYTRINRYLRWISSNSGIH